MSLDFSLYDPNPVTERCECPRCGDGHLSTRTEELFSANITHNLAVGIYMCLWRPEECDIITAAQCIPILEEGLRQMNADPVKFRAMDASTGWGTYKDFIPWIERVLAACREDPEAHVRVSR